MLPQPMTDPRDHLAINRAFWDERVPAHSASPDYAVNALATDPQALSAVVAFDAPRLGDISGLRGVHLQCHIGTDTISLQKLGAHMTGLDFSPPAVETARALAARADLPAEFVCAELHDAIEVLGPGGFDLVYTGVGAICWLPEIRRWAEIVAGLLAPGGRLFMREGHPMLWTIDERAGDSLPVTFHYFEHTGGLYWDEPGTYVETEHEFTATASVSFNHGLGEIITALLDHGLTLTGFTEHRSVPWEALPGRMTRGEDGEWRLDEAPERLPLSYTLQATKPS